MLSGVASDSTPGPAPNRFSEAFMLRSFLAGCEESYRRTRNPVYVWDALAHVLASGPDPIQWTVSLR